MFDFIFEFLGECLGEALLEGLTYLLLHLGRGIIEFVRDIWAMF